jgi:hypothetical protein
MALTSQIEYTFGIMIVIGLAAGCDARPDLGTGATPPGLRSSRPPTAEQQLPATDVVLSWRREGGIAGFCDELKVSTTGEFTATLCLANPERRKTGKLSKEDLVKLDRWREAFGTTVINTRDAAIADAMTLTLTMKGTGSAKANDAERQELLNWAQKTFERNRP